MADISDRAERFMSEPEERRTIHAVRSPFASRMSAAIQLVRVSRAEITLPWAILCDLAALAVLSLEAHSDAEGCDDLRRAR